MTPAEQPSDAVVVISSHVARGAVGGRVATFALERLGFEVWAVPTVVMAHHPGLGPARRIVPDDAAFAEVLDDLATAGPPVTAILSGYLATPGQAEAAAAFVAAVRRRFPAAVYLCDPVIGDRGRLYVAVEIAEAIRDRLLPLADAATPSVFELDWLAGCDAAERTPAEIAAEAALIAPVALVTSAPALMRDGVANLLVEPGGIATIEHRRLASAANGTGDLLAAVLLGRRLAGYDWARAAELAVATTFEILAGSARAGCDALSLARLQRAIVHPAAPMNVRRLLRPV